MGTLPGTQSGAQSPSSAPEARVDLERVAQLAAYNILDTPPEEAFDDLVRLAAILLDAPIALVSLVDSDRQWFKARVGLRASQTPRSAAFCDWTIRDPDTVMVVPTAQLDPRFADNPLVVGDPHIRFYAGAPLRSRAGWALGSLCVIDRQPRSGLTDEQHLALRMLARQAEQQLELRRVTSELAQSERRLHTLVEQSADLVLILAGDGTIEYASAAADMLGRDSANSLGRNALDFMHPDDLERAATSLADTVLTPGFHVPLELRVEHMDGTWRHVEVVANNQLRDPELHGIVLHVRDITFRKEMEERIQRDQRQLADAQRVARMGSWEEDLRTGVVTWSEGLFRLYGLDPRTTRPSRDAWLATMHPDERDKVLALTEQAERDGKAFNVRRRVVRPGASEIFALCHAEVDVDERGSSCRIRGTVLDISAQVELERSLDTERRFLRAVLDNLEDGVVACEARRGGVTVQPGHRTAARRGSSVNDRRGRPRQLPPLRRGRHHPAGARRRPPRTSSPPRARQSRRDRDRAAQRLSTTRELHRPGHLRQ